MSQPSGSELMSQSSNCLFPRTIYKLQLQNLFSTTANQPTIANNNSKNLNNNSQPNPFTIVCISYIGWVESSGFGLRMLYCSVGTYFASLVL